MAKLAALVSICTSKFTITTIKPILQFGVEGSACITVLLTHSGTILLPKLDSCSLYSYQELCNIVFRKQNVN